MASRLQSFLPFETTSRAHDFDEVILFSGGLDSFAGALETLATTSKRVILLSHRSAQKTITHQNALGVWLSQRFPGRVLHLQIAAHRVNDEARETTQRSRSFLFAALGQVVAQTFGCRQITFFENGIVSQNLPLSPQVAGTMATRTTHPLALHLIDTLHKAAVPDAVGIASPYAWLTKTEVVRRIAEHGGTAQIKEAVSCTHVRAQDTLKTHCAACSQCLDRRFAMLASGLDEHEPGEMYRHDVLTGSRESDLSRTLAVDWTRHAVQLAKMDEWAFFQRFGQEVMRITRGHPTLDPAEVLQRTIDMHRRHGTSVRNVLGQAIVANAVPLAEQALPDNSLLVMHSGGPFLSEKMQGPLLPASGDIAASPVPEADNDPDGLVLMHDPQAPLVVELRDNNGRRSIQVRGLSTLSGRLVEVPWELSRHRRQEQTVGSASGSVRFLASAEIARALSKARSGREGVNKEWVNQMVRRCRQLIATDFQRIHGVKPGRHLLIETGRKSGYRLELGTQVIDRR